jgi:hypothetical protein
MYMSQLRDQQQTLRISSEGKDFVDIQLESSIPVTIRLQLDGAAIAITTTGTVPARMLKVT